MEPLLYHPLLKPLLACSGGRRAAERAGASQDAPLARTREAAARLRVERAARRGGERVHECL